MESVGSQPFICEERGEGERGVMEIDGGNPPAESVEPSSAVLLAEPFHITTCYHLQCHPENHLAQKSLSHPNIE